ncbi:TROVE domain-containing protein [Planotetraspora kaengkrachanensis]|uniref:RNA-binding protein n=1 Tax=Planotetraspora kaengkrachanensis TaxID=575193 RepID=A0A8J3LT16_9ACTN|nr:TROVE domain-containing protein [Planotetraspora kaengkrachanensis]GIG77647.1 RNA-binding protein [Planotetraspora kaengkrachanensis]
MTTPHSLAPSAVTTAKRELFLLAARALADGDARDLGDRFAALTGQLAIAEDTWVRALIDWTRRQPALRRLGIALTVEFVHARTAAGVGTPGETRELIGTLLTRPDEPGELLAQWLRSHGRSIPKAVKAGVADAAERLYDEVALATYDTADTEMRFAEVIALTHPKPVGKIQNETFQHAALRRRGSHPVPESLTTLRARAQLHAVPADKRPRMLDRPDIADAFAQAAMSWREVRAWLGGSMTDKAWATVVARMSYRDRMEHLRDFDQTDLAGEVADRISADLADKASVARGGALPVEILAAYRSVPSSRWSSVLEQALDHALAEVPALPGRTLILVDRSKAMLEPSFAGSALTRADAAAVFGAALALRAASADLVECGQVTGPVTFEGAGRLIDAVGRFGETGGAQTVAEALREHVKGHDRVVVLTHHGAAVEAAEAVTVPGHEHIITDVTDGWFAAITHIERARTDAWPF